MEITQERQNFNERLDEHKEEYNEKVDDAKKNIGSSLFAGGLFVAGVAVASMIFPIIPFAGVIIGAAVTTITCVGVAAKSAIDMERALKKYKEDEVQEQSKYTKALEAKISVAEKSELKQSQSIEKKASADASAELASSLDEMPQGGDPKTIKESTRADKNTSEKTGDKKKIPSSLKM